MFLHAKLLLETLFLMLNLNLFMELMVEIQKPIALGWQSLNKILMILDCC